MASPLDFAYLAGLILASPYFGYKVAHLRGRRHLLGLRQRLGACPPREDRRPCIWVHGVSVGEIRAARTLVEALGRELPEYEVVLSTTTGTGQEVAQKTYPGHRVFYFPLDFSWAVRRVLDAIRPDLVILIELEIWPNFLQVARQQHIPVALMNGRITAKSFRGYRLVQSLGCDPLRNIGLFCAQTERYAERFRGLGIPAERVHVTGSVKYDQLRGQVEIDRAAVRRDLGVGPRERILMAGSTHPGEEQVLLETYQALRDEVPDLRLILVPRHTERTSSVLELIRAAAPGVALRTERLAQEDPAPLPPGHVLLVDTVGELGRLYSIADLVFVGGSLIPHGGQNMLEPVMFGKPTLFGPHCFNFKEPVQRLLKAGGARQVGSPAELTRACRELLSDPEASAVLGARGRQAMLAAQGATERTVSLLERFLRGWRSGGPGCGRTQPKARRSLPGREATS